MEDKKTVALRKRAQIAKANKTMFMWVAIASVVVSVAVVSVAIMFQMMLHNNRALSALHNTVDTLRENNSQTEDLESGVRMLGSDESLLELRAGDADNALRVILDALPTENNPSAFGASLQSRLFEDVEIERVSIDPRSSSSLDYVAGADETELSTGTIGFRFVVRGNSEQLKSLLTRIEKSIRTIQILNWRIESSGDSQVLTVEGEAYFSPAMVLELKNVDIEP